MNESPTRRSALRSAIWRPTIRPWLRRMLRRTCKAEIDAAITGAHLPAELESLIRTLLHWARLWRSEQLDVAKELTGHFADGVAAGRDPAQLAADFGDVRRAARLIRRAKRRNRPLWWRSMRFARRALGVLLLSACALYAVLAIRYFTSKPTVSRDYLAELNTPTLAIPETDRAWPVYQQALLALEPVPNSWFGDVGYPDAPPGDPRAAEFAAYVERNAAAIATIRRAAAMPHLGAPIGGRANREFDDALRKVEQPDYIPPPESVSAPSTLADEMLIGLTLPFAQRGRTLARAVKADFGQAVAAGDGPRVFDDLRAMFDIASHEREQPFLITELVALAIDAATYECIKAVTYEHPDLLTTDQLTILAHTIAAIGDPADHLAAALQSERLGFLDTIQHLYTDDGHGDGRIAGGSNILAAAQASWGADVSPAPEPLAPLAATVAAGRREVVAFYDDIMRRTIEQMRTPLWKRTAGQEVDQYLDSALRGTYNSLRLWPASLLVPALGTIARSSEAQHQLTDGVLTAIALELFRRERGGYPATLAELTPRFLPAMPLDRFDGQPLRYHLVDGKPLLYSIGADRDDDGGRPPKWGNMNASVSSHWVYSPGDSQSSGQWNNQFDGDFVIYPTPPRPAAPAVTPPPRRP